MSVAMSPDQSKTGGGVSLQLTHSPRLVNVDAEPRVPADPRRREIPRRKLGSHSIRRPARHLFPLEAAPVPLLPHVSGGAPAPVALLLLPVQALRFRGARICGRGGAGGGSAVGLRVGIRAEAVKIHQLGFFLVRQLQLSQ